MTRPAAAPPALRLEGVRKRFGSIQALRGASMSAETGRVHAIVGENGAGKSTLVKIMSGVVQPDEGLILRAGAPTTFPSPTDATQAGIHLVHQELALLPDRTVVENVWLGQELRTRFGTLDWRTMQRRTREALQWLNVRVDVDRRVGTLNTGIRQFVEIARALVRESQIVILDEPTAALSPAEAEDLFAVVANLRARGTAIVYISHRLMEIERLADDVTVLKDGELVRTAPMGQLTVDDLVRLMVGREVSDLYPGPPAAAPGDLLLDVRGIADPPAVLDASLDLRAGEIVGLYGLEGHGQDELLASLAGARRPLQGSITVREWTGSHLPVGAAIRRGVGFVPEDRKTEGLVLSFTGVENLTLPRIRSLTRAGQVSRRRERQFAETAAGTAGVKGDIRAPAGALSGGNQQKLLLGRCVAIGAKILLLNQPTRGVDVGSKADIYGLIRELCDAGAGALVVSREIPELLGLCDRVLVMSRGHIVGEAPAGAGEAEVLSMAVTT